MKNNFYLALFSLFFSVSAFAQPSKGDVEIGVDIGYNFSYIISNYGLPETTDGLNVAGSFDYYFSNRWSLKAKVIYDQKGWDDSVYFGPYLWVQSDNLRVYNLNYITIPVMANWHFAKKRNWYLNFGPYIGFLINAEDGSSGTSIKQEFNTTDIGFAYGIGVKIPLNNNFKVFLEMDTQAGFSNIYKNQYNDYLNDNYYYDQEIGLNARGSFNVGLIYQINHVVKTEK